MPPRQHTGCDLTPSGQISPYPLTYGRGRDKTLLLQPFQPHLFLFRFTIPADLCLPQNSLVRVAVKPNDATMSQQGVVRFGRYAYQGVLCQAQVGGDGGLERQCLKSHLKNSTRSRLRCLALRLPGVNAINVVRVEKACSAAETSEERHEEPRVPDNVSYPSMYQSPP